MRPRGLHQASALFPLFSLVMLAVIPAAGARPSGLPLEFQVDIPDGYFEYISVDAAASTNALVFDVGSNVTVTTAFMSASQFSAFNASQSDIANSLYLENSTTAQATEHIAKGDYFLVFYAYQANANVTYNYDLYPNSPYLSGPVTAPEPSGIATFGLENASGDVTPYNVEAHEVVGIADIDSLLAHNATADLANSTVSGATLQLNSVLVVNEKGGAQQVYWTQNTPDFVTAASRVAYGDNLWNYSVSGFLSNATITSSNGGLTYSYSQSGQTQYYYGVELDNSSYALPLDLALAINETVEPDVGVLVQMGAQVLGNGSQPGSPMDWFDDLTIHDPAVTNAYFLVSGNSTTPEGTFYDAEFVFGGENDGESTNFNQMGASLQLLYGNSTGGVLNYFPSYYSFGQDTAESADNLHVAYSNGVAQVSPGSTDYVYLGTASGTSSISGTSTTTSAPEFPAASLSLVALVVVGAVAAMTRASSRGPTQLARRQG